MLPARVRSQAYRVCNETLDVVTGTEGPQWEAALLRYGTRRIHPGVVADREVFAVRTHTAKRRG